MAPRRDRLALGVIVAVALAVRLVHFAALAGTAYPDIPRVFRDSDMHATLRWAERIVGGDVLGRDTYHPDNSWMRSIAPPETWERWWGGKQIFQQAPFYAYWVAAWSLVSGGSLAGVLLAQLAVGALEPLVLYAVARRLFGRRPGLVAAALAAVYGPLVFQQGTLLRDWLPPLVEPLAILALLRARETGSLRRWMLAGAVLGLGLLVKESALLLALLVAGWVTWEHRSRDVVAVARPVVALGAGLLLVLLPLMARNAVVGAPLLSLSNRAAEGIIIGNAAGALPHRSFIPVQAMKDVLERSDGRLGRVVVETLRTHRGDWTSLASVQWLKVRGLVDPFEAANNLSPAYAADVSPVLRWLPGYGVVFPLGLAGVLWHLARWRALLPWLLYTASVTGGLLLAGTLGRYRLALVPSLVVFGAALLVDAHRAARTGRRGRLAAMVAAVAGIVAVQQWWAPVPAPRSGEHVAVQFVEYFAAAEVSVQRGDFAAAAAELERLRERVAGHGGLPDVARRATVALADVDGRRALALLRAGDHRAAREAADRAAMVYATHGVDLPESHLRLAMLYRALDEPEAARTALEQFLSREPTGRRADLARQILAELGAAGERGR